MYVHALHTVHAVPDLRVAAGRLRDGVSRTTGGVQNYFNTSSAARISLFDGRCR
jgi:hypothetical protein